MRASAGLYAMLALTLFLHPAMIPGDAISEAVVSRIERVRTGRDGKSGAAALFRHPHPGEERPAVIYLHGRLLQQKGLREAAEEGYDLRGILDTLADAGYAVLAPLYRNEKRAMNAVRQAVRFLEDRPDVDGSRIVLIGFSLGGAYALRAASRIPELRGLVLMSPALPGEDEGLTEGTQRYLDNLQIPVFLTLGKDETGALGRKIRNHFIPEMEKRNKIFSYREDYPGRHQAFRSIQDDWQHDILTFLEERLNDPAPPDVRVSPGHDHGSKRRPSSSPAKSGKNG